MAFDNHLMQPLFHLTIGKPGSSFAFEIARKIGLPEEILKDASGKIGEEHINFDRHLKDILRDKRYWENKRQDIRTENRKLEELVEQYEAEMSKLKDERRDILGKAREEAEELLKEANRKIENTIREIRETQADREKTRRARSQLDELKLSVKDTSKSDEIIERKIEKLRNRDSRPGKKKITKPVERKNIEGIPPFSMVPPEKGEFVIIEGTSSAGEVTRIEGKKVTVITGNVTTTVDISKLRRLTPDEMKLVSARKRPQRNVSWESTIRKSNFSPEKDVRGMRAEEALRVVQELVDEAIVIQYPTLRILHGKGDGILRQVIRQYLSAVPLIRSFRDENLESGGSGITIIDLDL